MECLPCDFVLSLRSWVEDIKGVRSQLRNSYRVSQWEQKLGEIFDENARITQPETGSEVKGKTVVRVRLLVLEKPFDERDETLRASVKVEGEGWQREVPLNRRGSLLTANINFPK